MTNQLAAVAIEQWPGQEGGAFQLGGPVLFVEGEGGILRLRYAALRSLACGLGRQDAFPRLDHAGRTPTRASGQAGPLLPPRLPLLPAANGRCWSRLRRREPGHPGLNLASRLWNGRATIGSHCPSRIPGPSASGRGGALGFVPAPAAFRGGPACLARMILAGGGWGWQGERGRA